MKNTVDTLHKNVLKCLENGDYLGVKKALYEYSCYVDRLNDSENMPNEMREFRKQRAIEMKERRKARRAAMQ